MTVQEQRTRAQAAARRDGLQVVGRGYRKADGAQVYCVPSRSQPGLWHLVVVLADHLECDCPYSRRGRVCAHRAAVHDYLLAGMRAALKEIETRDSAPLVSSNKPLGIWR